MPMPLTLWLTTLLGVLAGLLLVEAWALLTGRGWIW